MLRNKKSNPTYKHPPYGLAANPPYSFVMRKLLHAIHGMLKANKSFEGERFYKFPSEATYS